MLQLTEDELGEIIELTEEMCTRNGWVNEIVPPAKKRMEIITRARSRPHPAPALEGRTEFDVANAYYAGVEEAARKARDESQQRIEQVISLNIKEYAAIRLFVDVPTVRNKQDALEALRSAEYRQGALLQAGRK